jgi:hypothetical protein
MRQWQSTGANDVCHAGRASKMSGSGRTSRDSVTRADMCETVYRSSVYRGLSLLGSLNSYQRKLPIALSAARLSSFRRSDRSWCVTRGRTWAAIRRRGWGGDPTAPGDGVQAVTFVKKAPRHRRGKGGLAGLWFRNSRSPIPVRSSVSTRPALTDRFLVRIRSRIDAAAPILGGTPVAFQSPVIVAHCISPDTQPMIRERGEWAVNVGASAGRPVRRLGALRHSGACSFEPGQSEIRAATYRVGAFIPELMFVKIGVRFSWMLRFCGEGRNSRGRMSMPSCPLIIIGRLEQLSFRVWSPQKFDSNRQPMAGIAGRHAKRRVG